MTVFGVGALEILFILIIALIFIGPNDISKYARTAGRFLNRFYRSDTWRLVRETSRNLRTLPNRLAREAALEELEQIKHELQDTVGEMGGIQKSGDQSKNNLSDAATQALDRNATQAQDTQGLDDGMKAWTPKGKTSETAPPQPVADESTNLENDS